MAIVSSLAVAGNARQHSERRHQYSLCLLLSHRSSPWGLFLFEFVEGNTITRIEDRRTLRQ
jgi:hypothetical protein